MPTRGRRPDYLLGIDAGGSRTRAALATTDGKVVGVGRAGPANFRTGSFKEAAQAIQAAVGQATRQLELRRVRAVCIGSAGLEHPGDEDDGRRLLGDAVAADLVLLDTDAYIAWAGAHTSGQGIMVMAGTGSICLGIDADGVRHRVGGWGPRFGDEGSAYAIARQGIRRALDVLDGRGDDRALLEALASFSGVRMSADESDAPALTAWLYHPAQTASALARFAPHVGRLAAGHDATARAILGAAGRDLAMLAHAARRQLGCDPDAPVPIAVGGGVLRHNRLVRDAFDDDLRRAGGFRPTAAAALPVVGALIVALHATSPVVPEEVLARLRTSGDAIEAALYEHPASPAAAERDTEGRRARP